MTGGHGEASRDGLTTCVFDASKQAGASVRGSGLSGGLRT